VGYRTFIDRDGRAWEVRPQSKSEWEFQPTGDNAGPARTGAAPGYEADPFEMSTEELQRLLDAARPPRARPKASPFQD
jgi:hypothetical protein